eukprot:gnl/TRDRNA2_/TRDRNA2_177197_c4_seq13.p1 gnl/TRDRNA2_/TRDRNA2_177197_c4~~gnl/TRDRNA2_/TRDRNA2_177197_c4_seq13.p1  ORF type:complete len:246 (-),score=30.36 gnl/TRDRNA2_/TRDRNA2_177197_c4_seq13:147-884(-)
MMRLIDTDAVQQAFILQFGLSQNLINMVEMKAIHAELREGLNDCNRILATMSVVNSEMHKMHKEVHMEITALRKDIFSSGARNIFKGAPDNMKTPMPRSKTSSQSSGLSCVHDVHLEVLASMVEMKTMHAELHVGFGDCQRILATVSALDSEMRKIQKDVRMEFTALRRDVMHKMHKDVHLEITALRRDVHGHVAPNGFNNAPDSLQTLMPRSETGGLSSCASTLSEGLLAVGRMGNSPGRPLDL